MQAQPQWAQGQASQGPSGPNAPYPPQSPQPAQPPMPGAPPPPAVSPQGDLERRLNVVETRQALRGYSLIYAPMLLLIPLFLFVPFYEYESDSMSVTYAVLWELAAQGFAIGTVSILFIGVLAVLLGIGVFRPGTPAVPSGIAVICAILFMLLALKIDAGEHAEYSVAGYAGMILGLAGVITGIANEIHGIVRRMSRPR